MKKIICLVMILGSSQVFAKTMHFKCSGTQTGTLGKTQFFDASTTVGDFEDLHTVDMTENIWEVGDLSFEGVVVSPSQISVNGDIMTPNNVRRVFSIKISRNDLSIVDKELSRAGKTSYTTEKLGQCEIVEAPKVERAF